MGKTSWFLSPLNLDHVAVPMDYDAGQYQSYGFPVYPAGQLRSSSLQLARHLIAFMQDGEIDGARVLEGSTVAMMRTIQYPQTVVFPGYAWGLGWYRIVLDSPYGYLWGHTGGIFGVSTLMYCDLDEDIGVIYLTNVSANEGHSVIANALLAYAYSLPDETPTFLVRFGAVRRGRSALLSWEVAYPAEQAGFHIWRRVASRDRERVSEAPIRGGLAYEFMDANVPTGRVEYLLQQITADGAGTWLGLAVLEESAGLPASNLAVSNYPNPFNPRTYISFRLNEPSHVTVQVLNASGRRVTTLLDEGRAAGDHGCWWDGRDARGRAVASGTDHARRSGAMTLTR
jgi:hypothetical protein